MPSSSHAQQKSADDQLDLIFHALSDRTRRAVLARLSHGPASVSDVAKPFAMTRPAISKHLRVLEAAELVTRSVDGRVHLCSLQAGPLRDTTEWLEAYRGFWDDTLDALSRYAEAASHSSRGRKAP